MKKLSFLMIALFVAMVAPQITFAQAPKAEKAETKAKVVLKQGDKCIDFSYLDINGKTVRLKDLKGKYVLIDVWATWCGPCKNEIPHLQLLEEKMHGKNIEFVSISVDRDKAKWEEMVKGSKLSGIQLHTGGDQSFIEAFGITGIPRFILLDKKGCVVRLKMTRPSDQEEIYDSLMSLKGI